MNSCTPNNSIKGFTLTELVIAMAILVIVLLGLTQVFIYCMVLSESAGNATVCMAEIQGKLEEMRSHNFPDIAADYSAGGSLGDIFTLSQLNGTGVIFIDNTNPQLLEVRIVASWQEKANRIVGEDTNLNGILDAGEDSNGNGGLDSPVSLVSLIVER